MSSKVNAAVSISNTTSADSKTNEEAPPSEADQGNLISLYYIYLGAPPPKEWNGEGRTVSEIVRGALRYGKDQRMRVKEVITNYHFTILVGVEYNPQRKSNTNATAIKDRSHVQQMVCNYIETEAQLLVIWCIKYGEHTMTCSAVVLCVQRMKKRVSLIKKCTQGQLTRKAIGHAASFALLHRCFFPFVKVLGNTSIFLTSCLTRSAIYQLVSIQISSLRLHRNEGQFDRGTTISKIWCVKYGEHTMTCSAVVLCVQRMKNRVSLIKKCTQGQLTWKAIGHAARFALLHRCFFPFAKVLGNTSIFLTNCLTRSAIYQLLLIQISSLSWI
jgi:hypothetical protein